MKNLMKKVGMMMIMILSFNLSVNAQGTSLPYELDNQDSFVGNGWIIESFDGGVPPNPLPVFTYYELAIPQEPSKLLTLTKNFNLHENNDNDFTEIEVSYTLKNGSGILTDVKLYVVFSVGGALVDSSFIDLTTAIDSINKTFTFGGDALGVDKEVEIVIYNKNGDGSSIAMLMSELTIKASKYVTDDVDATTSTQEITTGTNLTVFTSNKTVHISSPTDLNDSNVLIYNMNGQLVANIIESIYNDTQIDLNFLNNGMYVMILLDETGNELIKQKISI